MTASMQSTNNKAICPQPHICTNICDIGGGSGPPRLHAGVLIILVKKNRCQIGERLKTEITPKNFVARTLVIILLFIDIHTLSIYLRWPNKI